MVVYITYVSLNIIFSFFVHYFDYVFMNKYVDKPFKSYKDKLFTEVKEVRDSFDSPVQYILFFPLMLIVIANMSIFLESYFLLRRTADLKSEINSFSRDNTRLSRQLEILKREGYEAYSKKQNTVKKDPNNTDFLKS